MTREEVLEIDAYCREHKVSYRQRLEELDIPFWNFYKAKKKYRLQDEAAAEGNITGGFVQPGAVGFLGEHVNTGAETADIAARTASAAASKLL